MATKINKILQKLPGNSLLYSSWMIQNNISPKEQTSYLASGWLERLTQGVYFRAGDTPTLYAAVASYNEQLGKNCFVGASTALDIQGYSHFVAMGKPTACLFTSKAERLPRWMLAHEWDMNIRYSTTKIFGNNMLGVEKTNVDGFVLPVSSPERAFMECLHLAPKYYSVMDLYYVMEMLTTLRPQLVQQLLAKCTSLKVKRLFMYMADKSQHQWSHALDRSLVDVGSGKRSFSKNGVYNSNYLITIPKELAEYE